MSLATLKRKTKEQYNNSSVGHKNFSINGTTRNLGYVGQTMLSRHFPRTPMKGNTAVGHGGLNGAYFQGHNIVSGIDCLNDNHIIKPSVVSTQGMLMTKFRWVRRSQPFTTVKYKENNDQQTYITNLNKKTLRTNINTDCLTIESKVSNPVKIEKTNYNNIKKYCNIIKSPITTQGDYLSRVLPIMCNKVEPRINITVGVPTNSSNNNKNLLLNTQGNYLFKLFPIVVCPTITPKY
jgi:hypothetical protein